MSKKRKNLLKKNKRKSITLTLEPKQRRNILIIIFFVLTFISFLSIIGLAGRLGEFLKEVLRYGFGWQAYLVPFIFAGICYFLFKEEKKEDFEIKRSNLVGLGLFIASLSSLFHLFYSLDQAYDSALQGKGGGYLGYVLSFPMQLVMGFWATFFIFLALFLISLVLIFNITPREILEKACVVKKKSVDLLGKIKTKMLLDKKLEIKGLAQQQKVNDSSKIETFHEERTQQEGQQAKPIFDLKVRKLNEDKKHFELKTTSFTRGWKPYPLELLDNRSSLPTSGDIKKNVATIRQTLKNFGIDVEMQEVSVGPTVTQYTLKPAEGIKLSRITALHNDLALALAAHPLRIEAPIPGRSLVGIEVPNQAVAVVRLREILESEEFAKCKSGLNIVLGRSVAGKPIITDLSKMPHLLISGATGSGKSICLNSIILTLVFQKSPDEIKFILVDPKKVEMTSYNEMPYLLTPVVTEVDKTINALKWLILEMERRFKLFSETRNRDIVSYNHQFREKRLPYLILIIDELADLMAACANEVEACIVRLAQMARAVGIHLILATQRPSVNVITGLIKANITSRIAFAVASQVDSRTIIDTAGAEKLLGSGDMLYIDSELGKPKRIQGAFVSEEEIKRVTDWFKKQGEPEYNEQVLEKQIQASTSSITVNNVEDELFEEAKEVVVRSGKASASLLQRRLRIGYARAARLLDILEEKGIIGPANGAKPREILTKPLEEKTEEEGKMTIKT